MIKEFSFIFCLLLFNASLLAQKDSSSPRDAVKSRVRVFIDNDFGGDPDGLFQLTHHLLSPSVEICGIIGSQHYDDGFYGYPGNVSNSRERVNELLNVLKLNVDVPVFEGSPVRAAAFKNDSVLFEGAKAIVREAMRTDTKKPLYVVCGAGLTNLAIAYKMEPRIAKRLTLVWIGGPEYKGLGIIPPKASSLEYNLGIDLKAVQTIFNQSEIPIWQVPRNAYRLALYSYSELYVRMHGKSIVGDYLLSRLEDLMKRSNRTLGEAYVLGDSPLVLLTALHTSWEQDPASSHYHNVRIPMITDSGLYEDNPNGRFIRVYTNLDTRLMIEDFFAKLELHRPQ